MAQADNERARERERERKRMEIRYVCINCDSIGICHLSHQQIVLCRIFLCIHNHADGCLPNGFVYTPKIYTCSSSNTHTHTCTHSVTFCNTVWLTSILSDTMETCGQYIASNWSAGYRCSGYIVGGFYDHSCMSKWQAYRELYETMAGTTIVESHLVMLRKPQKKLYTIGEGKRRGNCSSGSWRTKVVKFTNFQ